MNNSELLINYNDTLIQALKKLNNIKNYTDLT